jgi:hypothetical protein
MINLKTLLIVTCPFFLFTFNSKAQNNALALNGAYIVMNGGTETDNIKLVVNQSSTSGIIRLAGGGHIHSENQYNGIKWMTNNGLGSFTFPFGVGGNSTDYIPFIFNKTAGNSDITMSTWGTNQQNSPKPNTSNVPAVTNMLGTADSVLYAIDRFWDIHASGATADLTFSYLGSENTTIDPTSRIMAQHWNGSGWDSQVGSGTTGVTAGVGTAGPFINQNTFSPWVLSTHCSPDLTTTTIATTITANANSPATYQWIDCNNGNAFIPGETGQSYTATVNGDYAVIVTQGVCIDTSACININTVSIESHNIQNSVTVYPNPATEKINVVIDKLDPTTSLKLIDNLGKVVYQIKPTNELSIIDMQSLSRGVYTLIIINQENTINKRIIKQ